MDFAQAWIDEMVEVSDGHLNRREDWKGRGGLYLFTI